MFYSVRTVLCIILIALPGVGFSAQLDALWDARSAAEAEDAAEELLRQAPDFWELHAALERGRSYFPKPGGRVDASRIDSHDNTQRYFFVVPESYEPTRRYPVRMFLHGSINRDRHEPELGWWPWWERLKSEEYIAVYPEAWNEATWWSDVQVENFAAILRELRREYNCDEERQSLSGLSDGGSGTLYHALRASTPWASFLPFIGHPAVLYSDIVKAQGQMYAVNLSNKPMYFVNGDSDKLYPAESLVPWIELFRRAGTKLEFVRKPSGHTVRWWPEEEAKLDAFRAAHPRVSHPHHMVWESESPDLNGRHHWLRIDEIGRGHDDHRFVGFNRLRLSETGASSSTRAFPHPKRSGRMEVAAEGNDIHVLTREIHRYTLFISPELFDFDSPVSVWNNGRLVYSQRLEASLEVLLRSWLRDEDRTMLYGAEIEIRVPEAQ